MCRTTVAIAVLASLTFAAMDVGILALSVALVPALKRLADFGFAVKPD